LVELAAVVADGFPAADRAERFG